MGAWGGDRLWSRRPTVIHLERCPRTCLPRGIGLEDPEVFCSQILLGIIGLNKVSFYSDRVLRAFAIHLIDEEDSIRSVFQT